jgi:hypothetical protein
MSHNREPPSPVKTTNGGYVPPTSGLAHALKQNRIAFDGFRAREAMGPQLEHASRGARGNNGYCNAFPAIGLLCTECLWIAATERS